MAERATYIHGHHASVVSSHARRTIHDSAAFLLPHLKPTDRILDLGCGPGSITIGLAQVVSEGSVIGGDAVDEVLEQANELAAQHSIDNVSFQRVDGNSIPFQDGEFDVCYCHQLLQHVADPVGILREMRRVTKRNGIVAARDADYKSFAFSPETDEMQLWNDIYLKTGRANNGEPNAGRYLKSWAKRAGFAVDDIAFSWTVWTYQGEAAIALASSWKDRVLYSSIAKTALEKGTATPDVLERIAKGWMTWGQDEDALLIIPHGEIICHVR